MARKTALITGGSRGIGYGIAQALAAEGWNLLINGVRDEASVGQALDSLRSKGVSVAYAQGDIGTLEGRNNILHACWDFSGGALNLLVNNAGVAPKQRLDIMELEEEGYDYVMDTNLKGTFFLTQQVVKDMIFAKQANPEFEAGVIVVSSISATVASVNRGEYCLAKAGLAMMTQLFAARLGKIGIPAYEIRPGVIRTDMTAGVVEKYDALIAEGLCVQPRWGLPEDIAKCAAALARGDMPYSSGQVFMVDGGLTVQRL